MKTSSMIIKLGLIGIVAASMLTGCTEDDKSNDLFEENGSSSSDKLQVYKTSKGFNVSWTKESSSYAEVIYTDDLSKARGDGYPLTANYGKDFLMTCQFDKSDSTGAYYDCDKSNTATNATIHLKKNIEYKWLVSSGFSHTHGEVEATMEYSGSTLSIQ